MRQFLQNYVLRKRVFFLVLLIGAGIFVWFSPLRLAFAHLHTLADFESLGSMQKVRDFLTQFGVFGYLYFVLASAVLCALGMPRLLVCALAGLAYGVWWGVLLSQIGVTLGAYATFVFARVFGADFVLHKWPKLEDMLNTIESHGIVSIFLIRQMPISGFVANVVLGLSAVAHWEFLLGSFVGFLPEAVPAVFVGAGVQMGNVAQLMQLLVAAICLLVFLSWLVKTVFLKSEKIYSGRRKIFEGVLMSSFGVVGVVLCVMLFMGR